MSIFDGDQSMMNPLPWLQEKTLQALQGAADLVDLSNEPDTTPYYARKLKQQAALVVSRLAPVVALLHGADNEAANPAFWKPILERGSFAFIDWCKRFDIRNPVELSNSVEAEEWDEDEREEKADKAAHELLEGEDLRTSEVKLSVFGTMAQRLMQAGIPRPTRHLLLWLMFNLRYSNWADVVLVSRRFLPGDIGCDAEETAQAYRDLYDRGWILREDEIPEDQTDRLALALIVEGLNDRKHPAKYREEEFGYAGARVGGERTLPNTYLLRIPKTIEKLLLAWNLSNEERAGLRQSIQTAVGEDRIFIEEVGIEKVKDDSLVSVRVRIPRDSDEKEYQKEIQRVVEGWLRRRFIKSD
jgi:hypothetical protein